MLSTANRFTILNESEPGMATQGEAAGRGQCSYVVELGLPK